MYFETVYKGDEMGLGKTLQIISLCVGMHYAKKSAPILIIVPCTLQRQARFKNSYLRMFSVKTDFQKPILKRSKVGTRI